MLRLNNIDNINSALAAFANNEDVRPDKFYNRILEDTIKVPLEDYVHVQQATQVREIDPAYQRLNLRRLGSWTPHTEVLKEGIPPRPDLTRSESINISYMQFGRFAYFTDQVKTDVLDDFVAHYTKELADLANRTLEKFAREKLLSTPTRWIAGGKKTVGELIPGDIITIADLRLMVSRMERELVKPINGVFHYIASPEFMYDLLDDPYIENYMRINQSTFNMYNDGEPISMFKIKFFSTRLDEHLTPDLDHPGEYINADGGYNLRLVGGGNDIIFSVVGNDLGGDTRKTEDLVVAGDITDEVATRVILTEFYYRDGSAIENRVFWKYNLGLNDAEVRAKVVADSVYKLDANGNWLKGTPADVKAADLVGATELPIHRGILTGNEGLIHLRVKGQGSAQIILKELGSGGTSDPLNQLSSIGFKLRGVGFGFLRPEAVYATYGVPYHAIAMSGLTAKAILGNPNHDVEQYGVRDADFNNPEDLFEDAEHITKKKEKQTPNENLDLPVDKVGNIIPVTGVKIEGLDEVEEGSDITLTTKLLPKNATKRNVAWTSSNVAVATVVAGVVTGLAEGTTIITATVGGVQATHEVVVTPQ